MSLPYFPLYADRYEADTAHLSILEDGAYNRLLRLCWRSPGCKLPNDLPWIMRQMRAATDDEKAAVSAVLDEFFTKGRGKIWNPKLLKVHEQVSVAHQNKSEAGKKGVAAKALKKQEIEPSTAKAQLEQPLSNQNQNQNQTEREEDGGDSARGAENQNPEGEDRTIREQLLQAIGVDPVSGLTGRGGAQLGKPADMAEAGRWLALPGLTVPLVIEEIRRVMAAKPDGPPSSFGYFTKSMQRLSGAISLPPLQPEASRQPRGDPGPQRIDMASILAGINSDGSLKQ